MTTPQQQQVMYHQQQQQQAQQHFEQQQMYRAQMAQHQSAFYQRHANMQRPSEPTEVSPQSQSQTESLNVASPPSSNVPPATSPSLDATPKPSTSAISRSETPISLEQKLYMAAYRAKNNLNHQNAPPSVLLRANSPTVDSFATHTETGTVTAAMVNTHSLRMPTMQPDYSAPRVSELVR